MDVHALAYLTWLSVLTIWEWTPAFSTLINFKEWILIRRQFCFTLGGEGKEASRVTLFQLGSPPVLE